MGDRCNIVITMRRDDLARFAPHVDAATEDKWWDELHEEDNPVIVTVSLYDVNYALCDPRSAAAEAGIPFYGNHSEGDEYSPGAFVSWEGRQYEAPRNKDGDLVIAVDEDLEPFGDLKRLRDYVKALRAIRKAFTGKRCRNIKTNKRKERS